MKNIYIALLAIVVATGLWWMYGWYTGKVAPSTQDTVVVPIGSEVAYVAGGCFWCTESDFEKLEGVSDAISGYMGGAIQNPSYREVASGGSGHREAVKVVYDPAKISYRALALALLQETDPTDDGGSFYDRGHQYTSAIYYQNETERMTAEALIAEVDALGVFAKPITTSVEPAGTFWVAEEYHQDYYKKNPLAYKYYRTGSGRDAFIESVWGTDGAYDYLATDTVVSTKKESTNNKQHTIDWENYTKPSDSVLRSKLTNLQYFVTQEEGTETPFQNEYWDNHEDGIYVDIVSGEPLFSSTDKYDSGTGWPSFLKPINYDFVTEHKDFKLIIPRTEIRSRYADSHLGHIILDGPVENNRIRYCMNSAALRFVPLADLEAEGLGEYVALFE